MSIAIEAYKDKIDILKDGILVHTILKIKGDNNIDIPVIYYDMLPEIFEALGHKVELCWDYHIMG